MMQQTIQFRVPMQNAVSKREQKEQFFFFFYCYQGQKYSLKKKTSQNLFFIHIIAILVSIFFPVY